MSAAASTAKPAKRKAHAPASAPQRKRAKQQASASLEGSVEALTPKVFRLQDDKDAWKAFFEEHGYVAIGNVVGKEKVEELLGQFFADLAALGTGIQRTSPQTLVKKRLPGIASVGIFKDPGSGFGQCKFLWDCRVACRGVFEALYDDSDLVTSFDGCSFFPNWALPQLRESKTKGLWLHLDQGLTMGTSFQCAQGFLNLVDANEHTGGLVVVPGSHKHFAELLKTYKNPRANFLPLDTSHEISKRVLGEGGLKLLCVPAGSVVLWDSRLVHSNLHALKTPCSEESFIRCVAYVCMLPRSTCPASPAPRHELSTAVRKQLVREGQLTNHWPFASVVTLKKAKKQPKAQQGSEERQRDDKEDEGGAQEEEEQDKHERQDEEEQQEQEEGEGDGNEDEDEDDNPELGKAVTRPMQRVHMIYPRHKTFMPLKSAALPPKAILSNPEYAALI